MIHRKRENRSLGARSHALAAAVLFSSSALVAAAFAEPRQQTVDDGEALGVRMSSRSLVGSPIVNELGYENAMIEELLIDPETGHVDWIVVALDPESASTVAVPWHMLVMEADGTMRVAATADDLVPLPDSRSSAAPSVPTRRTSSTEQGLVPKAEFFPEYDSSNVHRYEGVVVGSVVAPVEEGVDVLILVVDVAGEDMRIHVGPEWYVERQGIEVESGDAVSFTGSLVSIDGEPVVLVSELTSRGRRAAFRNDAGSPLW